MKSLVFWIALSKLFVLAIILFAGIGLMPDEAQYWTWSKELSYGYYSKPPAIAWQIAAGCYFFGDTELGVRVGGLVLSFILSLSIYYLTRACGLDHKKGFWTSIAFSYSPLGIFSGFFATTDCAYVLFWTIAAALVVNTLRDARPLAWAAVGLVIGVGALWKWPVYAVWIPISIFYWRVPLRLVGGMCLSLLGLIPSFIWNYERGFPTFHHVAASIDNMASRGNPLDFLGAQAALVSPIFFVLILIWLVRFRSSYEPLQFCWVTSVLFLGVMFVASCFEKVQGNWAVAAYPTAFLLMVLYSSRRWFMAGLSLSIVIIALIVLVPLPYKMNPFKQGLGSSNLKEALIASGYRENEDFLFSDRYQITSLLSFYGPAQKRAYFFNLHSLRHNQFDFWRGMADDCVGKTGYFVEQCPEQDGARDLERLREKLLPYFADVAALPVQPLYANHKVAIILRATNYNGNLPAPTNKY